MSKLSMLAAGSMGFLLGSRAGRAPYEKAAATAARVKANPKVQAKVDEAKSTAGAKVTDLAATAKDSAVGKAKEKVADLRSDHSDGAVPPGYGKHSAPQGSLP